MVALSFFCSSLDDEELERVLLASITGDTWLLQVCTNSIVEIQKLHVTAILREGGKFKCAKVVLGEGGKRHHFGGKYKMGESKIFGGKATGLVVGN